MKSLNLTYALKDGVLVHISQVSSGLQCGCKCPACVETLIAKKGDKVIHHFAHKSTIECEFGYQTSLHLAAKKIISENGIMRVPAVYLEFPNTDKRELIEPEEVLQVSEVILEKKLHNIIPDILLVTNIGKIIVEIFVTYEIDLEKEEKIKKMGIPTIEIDLSKIDRNISEQELQDILINENEHKVWIYNGKREAYYEKFLKVSEVKPVITRNYALHVDNCPIGKRVWKCNRYANLLYDCQGCDYLIGYESTWKNNMEQESAIRCTGKLRIAHKEDFEIPFEKRMQDFNSKEEERIYESVGMGICPQCGGALKIKNGKYGEFFGCSNFPHCRFTFSYDD